MKFWIIALLMTGLALVIAVLPLLTRKIAGKTSEAATKFLRPRTLISLGIVLPVVGITLYMFTAASGVDTDTAHAQTMDSITVTQAAPAHGTGTLPSVEAMLEKLEQRLEQEPDDAKGWELLGRSYEHLGRSDAAEKAFARARDLGYQRQSQPESKSTILQGTVSLDPSLRHGVSATDTVFILARAVYGPRMPLAVQRKYAVDLPISYRLDDSRAMSPRLRLSDYPDVIVSARISPDGDAAATAGSLVGYSGIVHPGQVSAVNIVVNQESILAPLQQRSKPEKAEN